MLITNINLLIFLKDFILVFNCNIRKKKQVFNKEKQILIVINKKSIKKIKKEKCEFKVCRSTNIKEKD